MPIKKVIKRGGQKVPFDKTKIENAIYAVVEEFNQTDEVFNTVPKLVNKVVGQVQEIDGNVHVEQIQDIVEDVLIDANFKEIAKAYIRYREQHTQKRKEWITDELALNIWINKYQFQGESFEVFFDRVAGGFCSIKKMIKQKKFIPAGRILANRELHKLGFNVTYSNCYVTAPPEDNLESIFDSAKKIARTFSYGGGTGIDISKLRPKGSKVNNTAKTTTGPVSFADIYDVVSKKIGQKGRRAALMVSMICEHPDIENFIDKKLNLKAVNKANMSVRITDEFMEKVKNDNDFLLHFEVEDTGEKMEKEIPASRIFNKLAYGNWYMAEPGVLFWDRIKNWSMLSNDENFEYAGVNPCGEETLPAGGSCLLGAVNLANFVEKPFTDYAHFNYNKFAEVVKNGVTFLNEVLDEGLPLHPLKEQRENVRKWRQIGLGQMGLGSMLIKMGIEYGSTECLKLCDQLGKIMVNTALQQSALLAGHFGSYPAFKKHTVINSEFIQTNATNETLKMIRKYGLRNSQLLTIAPTGSTSNLVSVSGGIEPIFKVSYTRKTETLNGKEKEYKIYDQTIKELIEAKGSEFNLEECDYVVDCHQINYIDRINVQSVWQKYIDASISSTINLPNKTTIDEIKNLYTYAWHKGLKGVTVYRDGCAREGILFDNTNKVEGKQEMTEQDFIDAGICPKCNAKLQNKNGCEGCNDCGFEICDV